MYKSFLRAGAVVLFWLALWALLSFTVASPLLLPSPLEACKALLTLVASSAFYTDSAATFLRCFAGILLSSVFGVLTAALSYVSKTFRAVISLPVNFLKAVPVMAVIIYGLILLTSGNVPVLACFLMCYPIVHTNILAGLDYIDRELLEMGKLYDFSRRTELYHIYLPSLLPQIKASVSLMAGLSWKSVIAAEVLSVPASSMGYRLLEAKIYIETDMLFAWIIAIVALSLVFEHAIKALLERLDIREYSGSKIFRAMHIRQIRNETNMPEQNGAEADAPGGAHAAKLITSSICDVRVSPEIDLRRVSKRYGEKQVLDDLSVVFPARHITAVMAPSGKGKTTVLRLIAGLEAPDAGTISIQPKATKISYLFQEDRLLPWLNVCDNMAIALKSSGVPAAQAGILIEDMAAKLELTESLGKLPAQLSGGMKHRVSIGRALLRRAELLILDEPFRGLDDALKARLTERLLPYLANRTTILVTHDNENAQHIANKVLQI